MLSDVIARNCRSLASLGMTNPSPNVGFYFCSLTSNFCNPALLHVPAGIPSRRSADGETVDFKGGDANANWHSLSILAAGAYAFVEFEIVADHRDSCQHVRSITDQGCAFDRGG